MHLVFLLLTSSFTCLFSEYHNRYICWEMALEISILLSFISIAASKFTLVVDRSHYNYTSVPQDVDMSVTKLDLSFNDITYTDNTSFRLYNGVTHILMDVNPMTEIREGSFDNNPILEEFFCSHCRLVHLPADFGAATTSLRALRLLYGISDIEALAQLRLHRFPTLGRVEIAGNRISDINRLNFPTRTVYLDIEAMNLVVFPNLTASRFPNLENIRASYNKFQDIPSLFVGMRQTMRLMNVKYSKLKSVVGVETLPKLIVVDAMGNELETVPDLLGLKNLVNLFIGDNSRMTCDQRMCWRRLLNRVRAPLDKDDDVTCVHPPAFTGHPLSTINPKFMNCIKGNS